MPDHMILSHFQAKTLLKHRSAVGQPVSVSLDLQISQTPVTIIPSGIALPDGDALDWPTIERIAHAENNCFLVDKRGAHKIQTFSEFTNRAYSLMPTSGPPTMLVSGIPMHRIKGTDPGKDTLEKTRALRPIAGQVLDTATGLGYTAIAAAKTADHVITVELDPAALEIARCNPWSHGLFDNTKITQRLGDSFDVIDEFADEQFGYILHDPPVFSLAGHLYSSEFYAKLYRVLARRGRVFHYIGSPESKSGRSITAGVIRRLQAAGFKRVVRKPAAFGVLAVK